jgi:SOS-response transcriptional repressor LexA
VAATIVPISGTRRGTYVVLEAVLPNKSPRNIGVILVDDATGRGWVRLFDRFDHLTDDTEVLDALGDDLRAKVAEMGGELFLQSLEDSLSNVLRISDRRTIAVDSFRRQLDLLYGEHVEERIVRPFETHVPLQSFRAAAGGLSDEMQVRVEDWVLPPERFRLSREIFAGYVVGRSMEPRIPDGSLNLFRLHPVGSRQGKILLIQLFGVADESARFTVKRYTSIKRQLSEDEWEHERIRLEPLNPEFEAWDVGPEDFAVVAEWLCVIE